MRSELERGRALEREPPSELRLKDDGVVAKHIIHCAVHCRNNDAPVADFAHRYGSFKSTTSRCAPMCLLAGAGGPRQRRSGL